MNKQLLEEIKTAYKVHHLRPVRRCFFIHCKRYDSACPLLALAIHRGAVDRADPSIAWEGADNPAFKWATRAFGKEWAWGFIDGFDWITKKTRDPEYQKGHRFGVLLAVGILPPPSYQGSQEG
jgi:hypothetical protein